MTRLLILTALLLNPLIPAGPLPQAEARQVKRPISINIATIPELQELPGIGPVLAARIVEHRCVHGPFKRIEDVIIVRGMSPARFRRIARLIRI